MLSSEQVIPRYFTLLPTLRCLLYKPCGRPSSPHPSVLTVGNKQPRSPLLSPSRPHRPTNATPSMLFALARPSLPPPDCFLFRALCLVLCFRESPRGNDKQMSAALSLYNVYALVAMAMGSGRSAFLTRRHGVGEHHRRRPKDFEYFSSYEGGNVCKETEWWQTTRRDLRRRTFFQDDNDRHT